MLNKPTSVQQEGFPWDPKLGPLRLTTKFDAVGRVYTFFFYELTATDINNLERRIGMFKIDVIDEAWKVIV